MLSMLRRFPIAMTILLFLLLPTAAMAEGQPMPAKRNPTDLNDTWFYNRKMETIVPEIDPGWVTVVLGSDVQDPPPEGETLTGEGGVTTAGDPAAAIRSRYDEVVDLLRDDTIHPHALFLKMRKDVSLNRTLDMIRQIRDIDGVRYAHPTLRIDGKTWAYFDLFDIQWKTGVSQTAQRELARRAGAFPDKDGAHWRIDGDRIGFFTGVNLLAEDIRTVFATPVLKEVRPAIRTTLDLAIHGGGIGDAILFSLTVVFMPERVRIDPSSFTRIDLKPAGLPDDLFDAAFDPYDPVRATEVSPVRISGRMRLFAAGDYMIPPVTIRYTCLDCPARPVRSLQTAEASVKIGALIPPGMETPTLLVPTTAPSPRFPIAAYREQEAQHRRWSIVSLSVALLFLCGFLYLVRSERRRRRMPKPKVEAAPTAALFPLLDAPVVSPHWVFMADVSRLLRRILIVHYRLEGAPVGGTGAVFYRAVSRDLPEEISAPVRWILNETDVAAAHETHPYPRIDAFRQEVRRIATLLSR